MGDRLVTKTGWAVPAVILASILVAGCPIKRDEYFMPKVELPDTYGNLSADLAAGDKSLAAPPKSVPQSISRWWRNFENQELNDLIELGLANNYQLKAAIARIGQAQALLGQSQAEEWPELSGSGEYEISAPDAGVGNVDPGEDTKSRHTYQVGLTANYEIDLWGKNRAASEAALERAWASIFARETVALTLSADITTAFIQYLSFQDRIRTAEWTEETLKNMLQAVVDRLEGGEGTELQVAQQRAAVAQASSVPPVMRLQRDQALNRIALLVGKAPSEIRIESQGLADITIPRINPGLPSRLLLRRPDVREAESELIAADADIDAARAELFPAFELTGELGYGSRHLRTLLTPESLFWSLGATITQIIFDAGRRESEIKFAEAEYQELVHDYMQSVYTALNEVENALVATRFLTIRQNAQREAVAASEAAYELSQESYLIGASDYLTLLDTERTLFRNKDELHRIDLERLTAAIDLFKSIGGGMEYDEMEIVLNEKIKEESKYRPWYYADESPLDPAIRQVAIVPEKGFWIELAAVWSERAAWRHWHRMSEKFPTMLKDKEPFIRRVPGPRNQGTWAAMLLGPFVERNDADGLCLAFRKEGHGCQILVM